MDLSIGGLSRLSGVPVKTIRYYSDIGLLPERRRTAAGYRRYDETSLARLELVRTLRELGLDIPTTRRVADRVAEIEAVAAAQAEAADAHIRQLRLRRGVLRAIARGLSRPEEVRRMTDFARASAEEACRTMDDFLSAAFADHEQDPFAAMMPDALPVLPDEPSQEQIDAWIELAALMSDPPFRGRVREMVVEGGRQRAAARLSPTDAATQEAGQAVVDKAGAALAAGIDPASAGAAPIAGELAGFFARAARRADGPEYRAELLAQLERFSDRRVERYWQLIGIVNGWPPQPSRWPAYDWLIVALRGSLHQP
ncbi:MAG: MerR family transcriptional regulator [Candidatus Dormiibacterota bacterium]